MSKVPMVVSKRNHFRPADELVEDAMMRLDDQFKHPDFRKWLLRYTEMVIKSVASHFGLGAQRGIEQTANLLCDPDFYETKRRERARWTQKIKEDRARQEWERIERTSCPTAEQILDMTKQCEESIKYHQQRLYAYEKRLAELREMVPKNVRMMETKTTQ